MIEHLMGRGTPDPVAPFSHAVRCNGFLFVTGQMPTLPGGGHRLVAGGVEEQTRQVMDNLKTVLDTAGAGWSDVLHVRVYLTHFQRDYEAMNATYRAYFDPAPLPARTCIGVTGLAVDALVEIDLLARDPAGHGMEIAE